jgi:hydroxymethylpyrimidine kinase/phosphomethylpyrimidine kinase
MTAPQKIPNVLSIAGSDPSGGAGIQADLKTFGALGVYGMCVITALTAQNTRGVTGIHDVPADFVRAQIAAILDDIAVAAVKIGMLGSVQTIETIAQMLQAQMPLPIVLDPVMVAQSGDRLISDAAIEALKMHLIPMAQIITPNIPEGEVLLGRNFDGNLEEFAAALYERFGVPVLLKGGHYKGALAVDALATAEGVKIYQRPWVETKNNHGTGCTLSSALAASLAYGMALDAAVENAKNYITGALQSSARLDVGHGAGPVDHFFKFRSLNFPAGP